MNKHNTEIIYGQVDILHDACYHACMYEKTKKEFYVLSGQGGHQALAPSDLRRSMRRREVLRLRTELKPDGSRRRLWEIRDIIRSTPHLLPDDVEYNIGSVSQDILATIRTITDEVRELAHEYLPVEMEKLDRMEDTLWDAMEKTNELLVNLELPEDPDDLPNYTRTLERTMNTIDKGTKSLERILSRRAKYLPLEVAKEVHVKNETIKYSLDDFLRVQEELRESRENGDAIEGEFTDA